MTPSCATPLPASSFAELGVAADLVAALAQSGVVVPFPIQAASLRDSLAGRDVLGAVGPAAARPWPSPSPP